MPLSLGKVVNDEIVCPYHGWTNNHCGTCTRIPSITRNKEIPTKARTVPYSCAEEYGLIWVCIGNSDEDRPRIGDEKFKSQEFVQIVMGPYELNAVGARVVENFLDVSHLMFVHEGLLGVSQFSEISNYQMYKKDGYLVSDEIDIYQPDPDGRGQDVHSKYIYKIYHPFQVAFTKKIDKSDDFFQPYILLIGSLICIVVLQIHPGIVIGVLLVGALVLPEKNNKVEARVEGKK